MPPEPVDPASLSHLLPEPQVGSVRMIQPIVVGQSGAAVYAVTTSRGEHILRVQGTLVDASFWAQHLLVQRRAAAAGVAPAIVHVDEAARAIVTVRVPGVPLPAALAVPEQRERALAGVVEKLRALHGVETLGVRDRDPLAYARGAYAPQSDRAGYPSWATPDATFDRIEAALASDRRRVVAHNDLNPTNVLWDGQAAWLVDWDVAGLAHPHYDLAVLATFLLLGDEAAHGLLALHDRAPLDQAARDRFATLRQLAALISGLAFLSLVPDLAVLAAPTRDDAPTLAACYAEMRRGTLDMQTDRGRASFALALLRLGIEA